MSGVITVPSPIGNAQFIWDDVACGGAIWSLLWNGVEFVNRTDDGRLIQTALTTDDNEEAYNPTEGGALKDPQFGTPSDSLCFDSDQGGDWFRTVNRMALWRSGELSNFILSKKVTFHENTATFKIKVSTPQDYIHHTSGTVQDKLEVLTQYMPPSFSQFYGLYRDNGTVAKLDDGVELRDGSGTVVGHGGEQLLPILLSTPDGSAAVCALNLAWGNYAQVPACGYGRFRFPDCVKWNIVQRYANPLPGVVHDQTVMLAWGQLGDAALTLATELGRRRAAVRRLYWATLNRAPDSGGLDYYVQRLQAGESLTTLAGGFINSPEFQSKYGTLTDDAFVRLLYQNILGRPPESEAAVRDHLAIIYQSGRAVDLTNFSESRENRTRRLILDAA